MVSDLFILLDPTVWQCLQPRNVSGSFVKSYRPTQPLIFKRLILVRLHCSTIRVMMQGVSVIDFSPANNLLVTGSRDCTIRGWNPYASEQPVMVLRGHEAPVVYLRVNEVKVRRPTSSLSS